MSWSTPLLLALLAALAGCGTNREQTTTVKTVQTVETVTGPVVADVPMVGQVVVQPVRHISRTTIDTVESETEVKTLQMPDMGPIITAAAPALAGPLGIAGTLLGLVTTAAAGWMAMKRGQAKDTLERQRNEMIDGIERSKTGLPPKAWGHLTSALEAEQSRDTVAAVKARTT